MPKWDEAADAIRWLSGRKPSGLPLDVADDVARAATRVDPQDEEYFRLLTQPQQAQGPDFSGIDAGPLDSAPDFELGSPLWHQLSLRVSSGWVRPFLTTSTLGH